MEFVTKELTKRIPSRASRSRLGVRGRLAPYFRYFYMPDCVAAWSSDMRRQRSPRLCARLVDIARRVTRCIDAETHRSVHSTNVRTLVWAPYSASYPGEIMTRPLCPPTLILTFAVCFQRSAVAAQQPSIETRLQGFDGYMGKCLKDGTFQGLASASWVKDKLGIARLWLPRLREEAPLQPSATVSPMRRTRSSSLLSPPDFSWTKQARLG